MKSKFSSNRWPYFAVAGIVLLSAIIFFAGLNLVPPCLNADEASFSYNAYSILKTGRDEYGKFPPGWLISLL